MTQNSKIEWTHHTANLWWGCQKVHAGCDHCYAETLDKRWGGDHWGAKAPRRIVLNTFHELARYQKQAEASGEVHSVFVGSMMDIFEKPMPLVYKNGRPCKNLNGDQVTTDKLRSDLFQNISEDLYPNLLFLLLTKRPGNILKYIPESWKENPPTNVMYGTSPVDQNTADEMIPKLLAVPGRHFLSCEPLLGPIEFSDVTRRADAVNMLGKPALSGIDWVIVGGESGQGARPVHPDWIRSMRNQCAASNIPFFFKQWGEWRQYDHYAGDNAKPLGMFQNGIFRHGNIVWDYKRESVHMAKVGKKTAGRLLDGKEYSEFPQTKN